MRLVDASARRGKSHALNLAIRARRAAGRSCSATPTTPSPPAGSPPWAGRSRRHDFVACRFDLDGAEPRLGAGRAPHPQVERLTILPFEPFCPVAGGATLGFHRAVFEAVGGFDPAFPTNEDTDFCIRAYLKGYALRLVPDAVYNYRFRDTPEAIYRQAYAYARSEALLRRRYCRGALPRARPWLTSDGGPPRLSADG